MDKTIQIVLIIVGILLVVTTGFFLFSNRILTGKIVEDYNHTHTQAICNETLKGNIHCYDYEITCKGNQVMTANIIAGPGAPHEKDWKDPRGENGSIVTCE